MYYHIFQSSTGKYFLLMTKENSILDMRKGP